MFAGFKRSSLFRQSFKCLGHRLVISTHFLKAMIISLLWLLLWFLDFWPKNILLTDIWPKEIWPIDIWLMVIWLRDILPTDI
jgi:hypothetical protein